MEKARKQMFPQSLQEASWSDQVVRTKCHRLGGLQMREIHFPRFCGKESRLGVSDGVRAPRQVTDVLLCLHVAEASEELCGVSFLER